MEKVALKSRTRSISARLQEHRASILRDGARRFFISPLLPSWSDLTRTPHLTISDCIAAAHDWLSSISKLEFVPFLLIERACLGGCSVVASQREILLFTDSLPAPKRRGCDSCAMGKAGPLGPCGAPSSKGASGASPKRATIKER